MSGEPWSPVCDGCARSKSECSCERDNANYFAAVLAERDALKRAIALKAEVERLTTDLHLNDTLLQIKMTYAERDALKAEVERLKALIDSVKCDCLARC